jgi:hypothetical protein
VVLALMAAPGLDAALAWDLRLETVVVLAVGVIVLLAIAAATPLGTLRIVWWAIGHPAREFRQNLRVLAGALPILLLTLALLVMSTELWVVATNLTVAELIATLTLFVGLGLCFLLMVTATRIAEAEKFSNWDKVRDCLNEQASVVRRPKGAEGYGLLDMGLGKLGVRDETRQSLFRRQRKTRDDLRRLRTSSWPEELEIDSIPDLLWRERWNIMLVALVGQGLQVLAVSVTMALFLLGFEWLAVDDSTLAAWSIDPQNGFGPWSGQHLKVTALLATFAGLSYAVSATLLSEQRELFLCQLDHKMRQRLAVRALYRVLRKLAREQYEAEQAASLPAQG